MKSVYYDLVEFATKSDLDGIKYYIEHGADIHYALRWTSHSGRADVVKLLLAYGANINLVDNLSLEWISYNVYLEVVK